MRRASIPLAIGAMLWLSASSAAALGFGRLGNATVLGQSLNLAAAVHLEPDETLERECVSAEVFSGDNKLASDQVRVTLESDAGTGGQVVRITTFKIIDEPVVTVTVTAGCKGAVTRKFVVFVDPPLINLAQSAAPEAAALAPQQLPSQVAPLLAAAGAAPVSASMPAPTARVTRRPPVRPPMAPRATSTATAGPAATQPRARARSRVLAEPMIVAAPASGPRLKLEAAAAAPGATRASEPGGVVPQAAGSAPAAMASEPSRIDEQLAQLAKERERLQLLEDSLKRLRSETLATQSTVATLQSRLKEAESSRFANPLVYGLAWLSGLLALAMVALWWRQLRTRREAKWWAGQGREEGVASTLQHSRSGPVSTQARPTVAPVTVAPPSVATIIEPPVAARPPSPTPPEPSPAPAAEPRRELSVEELIDLEQQAEFFIVLGQDEAAIDLLMGHVRSTGGISPLPHLKLLEIYRRRGDRNAYERIRERFNRRFNAYAPDWDSDLQQGRSLEDYPEIIARLQALWITPSRVMETLDASLFRRQAAGDTFDLPAYRELLLLYSIARDLSERESAAQGVDLLLPIEPQAAEAAISGLDVIQEASSGHGAQPAPGVPLDFDLPGQEPRRSDKAGPESQRNADFAPGSSFLEFTDEPPPKPRGSGPG